MYNPLGERVSSKYYRRHQVDPENGLDRKCISNPQ